ncbi:MAG: hypothetical protein ACK4I8_09195, partial [Armatimonadota bacterium]
NLSRLKSLLQQILFFMPIPSAAQESSPTIATIFSFGFRLLKRATLRSTSVIQHSSNECQNLVHTGVFEASLKGEKRWRKGDF